MSGDVTWRGKCPATDRAGVVCGSVLETRKVTTTGGDGKLCETTVSRCLSCDTAPCPNCRGRDMNPSAKSCKHCGAKLSPGGGR